MRIRGGRRHAASALLVLLAPLFVGACDDGEPPTIAPSGIDELTIPLAHVDPDDFLADPDGNRWLRLDGEHRTIDGVVAVREGSDWYAEDTHGNVWWFAAGGLFEAGTDGVLPGLVLPAHPRLGDGWWRARVPGVIEERATVIRVGEREVEVSLVEQDGVATTQTYTRQD